VLLLIHRGFSPVVSTKFSQPWVKSQSSKAAEGRTRIFNFEMGTYLGRGVDPVMRTTIKRDHETI
jgi:hypothetical protein